MQSVGYYVGAERAYKGLTAFLHPLMHFLYARVNHAMGAMGKDANGDESARVARGSFLMMMASGAGLGLVCLVGAPVFIRVLLGPGFEPSIPVLRMFALVLLLDAIGIALGVQWMLPLGMDKQIHRHCGGGWPHDRIQPPRLRLL